MKKQIDEIILKPKENGVRALLLILLSYAVGIASIVIGELFDIIPLDKEVKI